MFFCKFYGQILLNDRSNFYNSALRTFYCNSITSVLITSKLTSVAIPCYQVRIYYNLVLIFAAWNSETPRNCFMDTVINLFLLILLLKTLSRAPSPAKNWAKRLCGDGQVTKFIHNSKNNLNFETFFGNLSPLGMSASSYKVSDFYAQQFPS